MDKMEVRAKASIGKKVGRLTITSFVFISRSDNGGKRIAFVCRCDCGVSTQVRENDLGTSTNSCGCLAIETARKNKTVHGMKYTPFYSVWVDMKNRCYNKKVPAYKNYGARGIGVSKEWLYNFLNFKKDMFISYNRHIKKYGSRNTQIDRRDNDKGYSKENCRWVTVKINSNNKRNNV